MKRKPTIQKEFDVIYGKLRMNREIKELIIENVALNKISDLKTVPLINYVERIGRINKYAGHALRDYDEMLRNAENILKTMRAETNIHNITKNFFMISYVIFLTFIIFARVIFLAIAKLMKTAFRIIFLCR